MSDEKVVKFYSSTRDESLFEEIVRRYSKKIYATAFRITHDRHNSEEVLQEVLIILDKKIDTFKGEAKFSTWLYRIAMNASCGYLRAERKRDNDISLENYAPYIYNGSLSDKVEPREWSSGGPYLYIYKKEAGDIIERAVNELPEMHRAVFQLKYVDRYSFKEIAEILGISFCAAKSRGYRARLRLKGIISDYFYEMKAA